MLLLLLLFDNHIIDNKVLFAIRFEDSMCQSHSISISLSLSLNSSIARNHSENAFSIQWIQHPL